MRAATCAKPYRRERKPARRVTNRRDRYEARAHLVHGRFDAVRTRGQTKTQGWITW